MKRPVQFSQVRDQKQNGRLQVFEAIRQAGRIARIDIAKQIGASPATVTAIAAELLGKGLIEEVVPEDHPVETRRGRPRVALKVRGEAHLIAGAKVARRTISTTIVDFEGNEVASHVAPLDQPSMDARTLAETIRDALAQACGKAGLSVSDISGVGIGLAGLVDAQKRFVHWSPSLNRRSVAMGAILDECFGCPVFLDNDANLVAKAEQLFGVGRGIPNFIVITLEHGVGMGIVIKNELYRGARGCGAEIGHTKVQLDGALCQCGQRGCLEAYVGDYALLREANIMSHDGPKSSLDALWQAAQNGDAVARAIFERARRMLALGMANVINLFDPEMIILAGRRAAFDQLEADKVIAQTVNYAIQIEGPRPQVLEHQWGDVMWAKGAAAYAIEGILEMKIRDLPVTAD
ncbi:ROK family transcriptional regulator [Chachezhania antarctica]|uniref:ROK family transcriptional regulator n=1 Tax=Chachezhania antarctica TaxID=2340860 RepID=UPI000EAF6617|nr:ROK family transcriptional regulator [Chachezhania antarctica]|tara:strand:- start:1514 stop:2731 length:1218 start_codon:yes stop_codon:yes gene_type:complete